MRNSMKQQRRFTQEFEEEAVLPDRLAGISEVVPRPARRLRQRPSAPRPRRSASICSARRSGKSASKPRRSPLRRGRQRPQHPPDDEQRKHAPTPAAGDRRGQQKDGRPLSAAELADRLVPSLAHTRGGGGGGGHGHGSSYCTSCARDSHGRIARSPEAGQEF